MAFVIPYDYNTIIRESVKNLVTDGNDEFRQRAENFAFEEMISYLCDYDVRRIFNFKVFSFVGNTNHKAGDMIIQDDGTIYICTTDGSSDNITDTAFFIKQETFYIEQYDKEVNYEAGETVADPYQVKYTCIQNAPAGTVLTDTDYFFLQRNPLIVMIYVDISTYHYHARINPNQIPQLRIDRHLDAIDKLKRIQKGNMRPALPRVDTDGDGTPDNISIDIWSNKKRDNRWS